jgi:hypothetical protein
MAGEKEVSFVIRAKDAASAVVKQIEGTFSASFSKIFSLKNVLKDFSGVLAGLSFGVIVKDLYDIAAASDKAMRALAANLPTGLEGIAKLRDEMNDLATVSGRSFEEVRAAGVEIARLGVSNPAEVVERLNAALKVADATGADLAETVHGLDQIMDAFGLSSAEASETLAKLVSAAKGRTDVQSLFDAFQSAAPIVRKLGLDADTTTRALVALLDQGLSGKQIRQALAEYDAEGIRELAKNAKIAETALVDLDKQAAITRDGLERMDQRIKNGFEQRLESVTDKVGKLARAIGVVLLGAIDNLSTSRNLEALLGAIGLPGLGSAVGDLIAPAPRNPVRDVTFTTPKNDLGNYGRDHIQTEEEKKKAEADFKKETEDAKRSMEEGRRALDESERELERARALAKAAQAEAAGLLATVSAAALELTGRVEAAAIKAIEEQNDKLREQVTLNTALTGGEKIRLLDQIKINEELEKQKVHDDASTKKKQELLDYVKGIHVAEIGIGNAQGKTVETDEHRVQRYQNMARSIEEAVRGALQLAEAFGLVDQRTALALENVAQIAANIPGAMAGDLGATLSVAGGIASIVSNFLGASKAQEEAAERLREAAAAFSGKAGTFWSNAFNANNPLAASLGGVTDQVNALLLELEKFRGSMNTDSFNQAGSVIKGAGDLKTSKIIADFWDSIAEALNSLDGPAGAYRNALHAIEKEYAEQQAAVLTLGNNEDDLAKIRELHQKKLDALNESEALRVQQIDNSLELRRLEALGLDDEAAALRRQLEEAGQLHQAELDGYSETQLATLAHVQALEDEAAAARKAADAAKANAEAWEAATSQGDRILGRSAADRARERASNYGIDIGDISTASGRDSVVNALRVMFQNDPTNKALADHIETLIGILESIDFGETGGPTVGGAGVAPLASKGATSSLTMGYQTLTIGQGTILADLERQQVTYLKSIDASLLSWRGGAPGGGGQSGGGFTGVRIQVGPFHIHGAGDPDQVAAKVGEQVARKINEKFGRDFQLAKTYRGDVTVS